MIHILHISTQTVQLLRLGYNCYFLSLLFYICFLHYVISIVMHQSAPRRNPLYVFNQLTMDSDSDQNATLSLSCYGRRRLPSGQNIENKRSFKNRQRPDKRSQAVGNYRTHNHRQWRKWAQRTTKNTHTHTHTP